MDLIDYYQNGRDTDFKNLVAGALVKKTSAIFQTLDPMNADHTPLYKLCKKIHDSTSDDLQFVSSTLAGAGLSIASTEATIYNTVDTYFNSLANLFDIG